MMRLSIILFLFLNCGFAFSQEKPNIILIMSDDQGWFDVGFNGNSEIITPNSDYLASQGITLNRFYSASPVCSPTRASVLTGKNPERIGIENANNGHLDEDETTLAELLKSNGYATGHFGKWHLGTFTTELVDANRGGRAEFDAHLSVPTQHGYDEYFATESKVPTFDPTQKPKKFEENENLRDGWKHRKKDSETEYYGTAYWETGRKKIPNSELNGDDSKLIMDRTLEFIEGVKDQPFFSTIWFHTPHLPMVTSDEYRSLYPGKTLFEQNYLGAITAMDDQIGRLWNYLEEIGEAENTIIFYCSDNGPEEETPGSAANFRADKRDLYEGGIRVPAFVVWKNKFKENQQNSSAMVTSDYFPTILDMLSLEENIEFDGQSVLPILEGKIEQRTKPIGFVYLHRQSWMNNEFKLVSTDSGKTFELFNLMKDPFERNNIYNENNKQHVTMKKNFNNWMKQVNKDKLAMKNKWGSFN